MDEGPWQLSTEDEAEQEPDDQELHGSLPPSAGDARGPESAVA